jgi:hypothetical protein
MCKATQSPLALHDNLRLGHRGLDLFVRQYERPIDAELLPDVHILAEHADALDARPAANCRPPAEDRVEDHAVRAHADTIEEDAPRKAHAVLDHAAGADDDVRTDLAALADLRARVDQHIALARGPQRVGVSELCRAVPAQVGEVVRSALQKVGGLLDVHPIAVEPHAIQLLLRR